MEVKVLGATSTVTGSKVLVETVKTKVLIDCGMYQGPKNIVLKNKDTLDLDFKELDAIVLTHAHLDHTGLIPLAVKKGFCGKIIGSSATLSLAKLILEDSSSLQKKEGPENTLYDDHDVLRSIALFVAVEDEKHFNLKGLEISFFEAGHILGAKSIKLVCDGETVYFSGDLGRKKDPIHVSPSIRQKSDVLYLESTYGDREHSSLDFIHQMKPILEKAIKESGVILIPSFAIARAQILLFEFNELFKKEPQLKIPIYVNSPMINKATECYLEYYKETKLDKEHLKECFSVAKFLYWSKETNKLKAKKGPHIIISASGMVNGGRVLEHLERLARFENTTICLTGFQSPETIGHMLLEKRDDIVINGNKLNVRADVKMIEGLSAHADRLEMLEWIKTIEDLPKKIVLVHGEEESKNSFKIFLEENLNISVEIA